MDLLHSGDAALCIEESDKIASPVVRTADHVYLRLRKVEYDDAALADWAEKIHKLADGAREIYIYFKHEAAAPTLARRMLTLLGRP